MPKVNPDASATRIDSIGLITNPNPLGKTPLIIDRSEEKIIDTFFSVDDKDAASVIISAKKMVVERSKDKKPVPEILEAARLKLVSSMKNGSRFVIMCENAAPDFEGCFNDSTEGVLSEAERETLAVFPKQLFQAGGKTIAGGGWPDKIYRADQKDAEGTIANVNEKFRVVITTRFAPESFEKFLLNEVGHGLPKPKSWYYPIHVVHAEGVPLAV